MTSRFPTTAEFLSFPEPNYVDPITRRPLALAVVIPMTVLVTAFISCRFYCRTVLIRTLGWDDWTMLAAAILSVGSNIMLIISMLPEYQMGYHLWDIKPIKLYGKMQAAQMGMASQLLFTSIITLMKVAILMTYLRIFPSRLNKWFCHIMIVYTVSLNVSCFFLTLFQCSPASTYWEIFKYIGTAKCLNIKAIYYFHSGQNTISDFVIFLWPAKDLLNVQVSFRQRITLTCMFSLGVIVCIAGVVRLYYTHLYLTSYDVFWHGASTFIIMSVESGVGVACGCLPGCKPLMNRMFPRVFASPSQANSYPRPSAAAQARAAKKLDSSSAAGDSYHMRSLRSNGLDEIVTEKELPAPPPPSRQGLRPPGGRVFGKERRYGVLDDVSDSSSEMIILQRRSEDQRFWGRGEQKV
ncbi:hypothetical protein HBH51_078270 [Parastagonospora nodorum]|nr:hypothetical protein HBH51_078270 [Parastagonospora nodorum]KAH4934576.1 hypothetical protein HBI79_087650 [Parastagonospora nodorum]KAH5685691.1 hypothetical protein HBI21_004850 [Parastagonospora nodorum]